MIYLEIILEKNLRTFYSLLMLTWSLLEKRSTCHNGLNESSKNKINKHTHSSYSLFTHCSFDNTKNSLIKRFKRACNKKNQL